MKICPTCNNRFIAKRLNQKYCSDSCRIKKNNEKSRSFRELTKTTNQILLTNRNILENLVNQEISEVDLKIKGFQFDYVTNFRSNKANNRTEFFCYDYGYFFNKKSGEVLISVIKAK